MSRKLISTIGRRLTFGLLLVAVIVVGLGGSCDPPNDPKPRPSIELVSVTSTDILPGDIVTVVFTTAAVDSVLVYPGGVTVTLSDTTSVPIQLFEPTQLRFIAVNSVGLDTLDVNITMSGATAQINSFTVDEAVMVGGDSVLLGWDVSKADSFVINNGIGKVTDSIGSSWIKPTSSTTYQGIAYYVGHDTAFVSVTVEVFAYIKTSDNIHLKGAMGSSVLDQNMVFWITTTDNLTATKLWYQLEIVEGDGTLSDDSLLSGGSQPTYTFSGSLGYAKIRAKVPGVDSVDVNIRASTLIPGLWGQGQYILIGDYYPWVETYNGTPERVDVVAIDEVYVVYEASLGVVFKIFDSNQNHIPDPFERVFGVIVNSKYDKTTKDGLGIDSSYQKMFSIYGTPNKTSVNTDSIPFMDEHHYDSLGLVVWISQVDSLIDEIHIDIP